MNLEGVMQILEDAAVATRRVNLFINFMPSDKAGILLRQPFGGTDIDHELPGYRKTSFMLIVRDKNYVDGKALMNKAIAALTLNFAEAGGMWINYMRPRSEPLTYQPSPGAVIEFSTNIDCSYVML